MSQYLKHQVKNAVNFISDFQHVMTQEARRRGCDGVVCGHIHKAEVREIDGILYCNDGDWVESMTALAETSSGEMKLIHWRNRLEAPLNLGRIADEMPTRKSRMKIALVTDAWEPQVNGVVRTLKNTARELQLHGPHGGDDHAAGIPHAALPDLPGHPPVAVPGRESHAPTRPNSIPMPSTSRPKARWDSRRGGLR